MARAALFPFFSCLSLVFFASLARPAAADVVGPPPPSCPAGSTPSTCHGGPHCSPDLCGANTDCTGGAVCKDVPFCVTTINCSGLLPPDADPSQYDKDAVTSACGACAGGAPCKALKVCVIEGSSSSSSSGGTTSSSSSGATASSSSGSPDGGESGGCACDLAGGEGPLGAAFAAFAATAALAFARRRRERA